MSDTRPRIEALLKAYTLYEYFEREDGIIWCLTKADDLFHILRVEEFEDIDLWYSYEYLNDAEKRYTQIVEEFVPGTSDRGQTKNSTLEKIDTSNSVIDLINLIILLLDNTDYLRCLCGYRDDFINNYKTLSNTERVIQIYDKFLRSQNKRQVLELISSSFFKHMTQDIESSEARESLDYLLSLLYK